VRDRHSLSVPGHINAEGTNARSGQIVQIKMEVFSDPPETHTVDPRSLCDTKI